MPSCSLHIEVTEYTWRSLCSLENHYETVFCELDLNGLLNHVCEPDAKPKLDLVQYVDEYRVCKINQDVDKVNIEKVRRSSATSRNIRRSQSAR